MRCHSLVLTLVVALGLIALGADDTGRVDRLIAQLGSTSFSEREQASRDLAAIGLPALEALKKAAQSNDIETRRRAEELVGSLEKMLESNRLLAPTKVTLKFNDLPVAQAVAELAKKSGQPVVLQGDITKVAGRKVTLELADTPFWQALEQFCAKAGLIEGSSVTSAIPPTAVRRPPPFVIPVVGPSKAAMQITLIDAKAPALPTHHAGAARLRALPASTHVVADSPKGADEILFALGLGLEAKVPLQRIINVRIDKALDENGQVLDGTLANATPPLDPDGPIFLGNLHGMPQAIMGTAGQTQLPIRLKAGAKPSRLLKELTGSVALEVRTPPEPVMTLDNILKAAGQTVKGKQGGSLTVHEVSRLADGQVKIRVELEPPADANLANNPLGAIQIQGQGVIQVRVGGMVLGDSSPGLQGLSLVDAKGEKYSLSGALASQMRINNNAITHEATLTFRPKAGQGEPAKLIYTSTQPATVEIPFSLKDVPLP